MDLEDRIRETFEPIRTQVGVRAIKGAALRTRRLRRASGGVVVVALAAAVSIVSPGLIPGGGSRHAAASTLLELAAIVRAEPMITVGPDQYLYSKTQARREACGGPLDGDECRWERLVTELWTAPDGSGRSAGQDSFSSWSEILGPGEMGGSLTEGVPPTDVDELREFIRERASHADQPLDYEMFVVVSDLLRETFSSPVLYSTPNLRSSLFEVAATLPGVEDLGRTTDQVGRMGVGIGYAHRDQRLELIFDSETAAILGTREVRLIGPDEEPKVIPGSWAVYLEAGVVDSVRDRP
jgi:hypothetical protein